MTSRVERRQQWWKEHKKTVQSEKEPEDLKPKKIDKERRRRGKDEKQETQPMTASSKGFKLSLPIQQKLETSPEKKGRSKKRHASDDVPSPKKRKTSADDKPGEEKVESEDETDEEPTDSETEGKQKAKGKKKNKPFVLFVGNLPFKANKDNVQKHFEKAGRIVSIRFPVEKETGRPRGFAFIEYETRGEFKRGLRMHHTKLLGREINVEFTSIGGNTVKRKEKLRRKNRELERFKRVRPQGDTNS